MKVDVKLPQLGESLTEGTILKWWKKVGEPVQKDETLLEISTDKVDSEIPSPATGTLAEIVARKNGKESAGNARVRRGPPGNERRKTTIRSRSDLRQTCGCAHAEIRGKSHRGHHSQVVEAVR
ncbi:MAG: hypothetical protein P8184_12175 [Calditrichia bacterium]